MIQENSYKAAWRIASNNINIVKHSQAHLNKSQPQKYTKKTFAQRAKKNKEKEAALAVGMVVATAAAQNQIKGRFGIALRVGGRIGVRGIPVLGAIITAYDVYRFLAD